MEAAPAAPAPAQKAQPQPAMVTGTCPVITTAGGITTAKMAIPTGEVNSSVVLLETTTPAEVFVGDAVDYKMTVTNLTDCPLTDVVLTSMIPANFDLKASAPQAQINKDGEAMWMLGDLAGKESKSVTVRGVPTQAGPFVSCSKVDYRPVLCTSFVAVAPKLTLTKTMASDVMACDLIPIKLVVANSGTGTVRGVKVVDPPPEGLTTDGGATQKTFDAGDLAAGQSKTFELTAKASRTGKFTNSAVATAGALKADAKADVTVRKPVLGITKTATKNQFAGRDIVYDIKVSNTGDAPANNLVVTDDLPAGVTVVSASNGGVATPGKITWNVGSLAPAASATFQVTVKALAQGTFKNTASAAAVCADAVAASAVTDVVGKAAILLEVIDVEDPLSLGDEETYTITATNQGTAPDTNIVIVCKIEDSMTFVSAGGQTEGSHAAGVVTFKPLASLASKGVAVWHVKVKAVKKGDVRFAVEMTTDELKRPVNETEATQIY